MLLQNWVYSGAEMCAVLTSGGFHPASKAASWIASGVPVCCLARPVQLSIACSAGTESWRQIIDLHSLSWFPPVFV